jgi:hypothetical protein
MIRYESHLLTNQKTYDDWDPHLGFGVEFSCKAVRHGILSELQVGVCVLVMVGEFERCSHRLRGRGSPVISAFSPTSEWLIERSQVMKEVQS